MTQPPAARDQQAFVPELDDVAEVLKSGRAEHAQHPGWSLRSTRDLACSCGEVLYPADATPQGARRS